MERFEKNDMVFPCAFIGIIARRAILIRI